MRFVNTLPLIFGLTAALGSLHGLSLPSDREQPIRVQADSAELDDKQGVAVYRGDVRGDPGQHQADRQHRDPEAGQERRHRGRDLSRQTCLLRAETRPDKDVTKAYGLTIQYFVTQNRVVLIDQAKVIQEGNTFEGEKIVYDTPAPDRQSRVVPPAPR